MLPQFLNAIGNLLCSKQCQHNVEEPNPDLEDDFGQQTEMCTYFASCC